MEVTEERRPCERGSSRPGQRTDMSRKHGRDIAASESSEGGYVSLSYFDSEEEAGIMHARARYKYPIKRP